MGAKDRLEVIKTYTISGTDNIADVDDIITFDITVKNIGDRTITGITLVDDFKNGNQTHYF